MKKKMIKVGMTEPLTYDEKRLYREMSIFSELHREALKKAMEYEKQAFMAKWDFWMSVMGRCEVTKGNLMSTDGETMFSMVDPDKRNPVAKELKEREYTIKKLMLQIEILEGELEGGK